MAIKRFPINLEQIGIDPSAIIKAPVYSVPEMPAPAPVKPPRAEPVKVPIKQPPIPVSQPAPMPPVLTEPPMPTPMPGPVPPVKPLPGESGPIIANPGGAPIPVPPMEPQIPMPAPVPQVPAPAPVPQPAPLPIPEPPMPAPMPQVPAPMPMPAPTPEPVFSIPTPVPQPAPEPILPPPPPPVAAPLPPAPPVNELPPPVQVPPPINLPAPPDDIVSRGTVGPVAPPPVEVPPPVMQPTPEPVAPPIPLAPSQPGVPTPMAPGSFQGVLPGPPPNVPVPEEVLSQIGTVRPVAPPPAPEPVAPPLNPPGSGFDPVEDVMSYQFYNPEEPVAPTPEPVAPTPEPAPALTPEQLVNQYNTSPAAQDFDLTATYDPQTNTFVEDVSAFGFQGDQATNTYTPQEFADRLGYDTETVSFTPSPEALVNQYNTSPAAQDFGVSVRYDPDTNTYIEDVSSFGFQGDQATNTYTQEEFLDRLGYGDPQPAPAPTPSDEPTGIETMAPEVGFGDYLGGEVAEAMPTQPAPQPAQEGTISLPDGSSFDLSTLDLTGLPGEGFDFEMPTMPGPTPPGPTPEPTPEPAPSLPTGRGMTLDDLVSLGQDAGGFVEPEMGTYTPGIVAGPQSTASVNNSDNFMGGFNPEDYVTPAGEFLTDGQLAEYGDLEPGTPIPTNTNNTGLTPEQQAALDQYLASNPGGINVDLLGFNPFGQNAGMGSFGSIPSGTVSDGQGSYTVIPVGPVGDLDNTGGQAPAPGPVNVRSASSYGLTGAQQTMPVSDNPFRRPETQGGIGSLAGGG